MSRTLPAFWFGLFLALAGAAIACFGTAATTARAADPAPATAPIRIAAGHDAPFKDSQGNTWDAEKGFTGGDKITRPDLKVTGTKTPELFLSEHYSMTSWSTNLPNGQYVLNLYFSEGYEGVTGPTQRVYTYAVKDGDANGKLLKEVKDFSPWKAAGDHFKGYVDSTKITVTKGQLTITFTPQKENAQINAIEIIPADAKPAQAVAANGAPDVPAKIINATNPPTANGQALVRIAAGHTQAFKDSQGNTWESDKGFTGGGVISRPTLAVSGTHELALYQSEHYSMDSWSWKVPNGNYIVKLHFCEGYDGINDPDQRAFTIDVNGNKIKDFSTLEKGRAQYKAYVETVTAKVTDGQIKITFTPQSENPQINGIEVYPEAP